MKTIFLSNNAKKIREVYSGEAVLARMEELGINIDSVFSEKDLAKYDFSEVEFVFSTWGMLRLDENQIKQYFPSLRAIFYAAGTVKYFAKPFINFGVDVFSADWANGRAVADYVTAQILLATKGFYQAQYEYKHMRFHKGREIAFKHTGNYEAVVGIIGAGKIGKTVISNLAPYDLNICICDPYIKENEADKIGGKLVNLEQLFEMCDVISNHLPDIESTRNILNYDLFKRMKDNATFINTGRGRQVVEKDLIRVLEDNKSLCAVLDVTNPEPVHAFNKLFRMRNVFLTPHIAGSFNYEERRMAEFMLDAYGEYIQGIRSKYWVSPESIDKMT